MLKRYTPVASNLPPYEVKAARLSDRPIDDCLTEIGNYLGVRHLFPVNSGRAALYAILKAGLPPQSKVILPGYTCYTVAAAVIRAGMVPVIVDSDPNDLGYDLDDLVHICEIDVDIKAIVVCHLFGIPVDITSIKQKVRPDILIIDDAAQAFGIKANGRFLGTAGDAGFYSFGRGKNLSLVGGGMIATDNDFIADRIGQLIADEFPPGVVSSTDRFKMQWYNFLTRPSVYGLVSRLPGMHIGRTVYNPDFDLSGMFDFKLRLLGQLYSSVEKMNAGRMTVADAYISMIADTKNVMIPKSKVDHRPGSLRLPLLIGDLSRRARIMNEARRRGLGVSTMYPTALNGVPELSGFAAGSLQNAEYIARSILTLPTHHFIGEGGEALMKKIVRLIT